MCFGKPLNTLSAPPGVLDLSGLQRAQRFAPTPVSPAPSEEPLSSRLEMAIDSYEYQYWLQENNFLQPSWTQKINPDMDDHAMYATLLHTPQSLFQPLIPEAITVMESAAPHSAVSKKSCENSLPEYSLASVCAAVEDDSAPDGRNNKRKMSLIDDIKEEEEDGNLVALKRKRNTEAARRSRQRKVQVLSALEDEVKALGAEKSTIQLRLAILENEKKSWMIRESELLTRVRDLEKQLSEGHQAIVTISALQNSSGTAIAF